MSSCTPSKSITARNTGEADTRGSTGQLGEEIASEIPVYEETGEPSTPDLVQPFLAMKSLLFAATVDPPAQSHTSRVSTCASKHHNLQRSLQAGLRKPAAPSFLLLNHIYTQTRIQYVALRSTRHMSL